MTAEICSSKLANVSFVVIATTLVFGILEAVTASTEAIIVAGGLVGTASSAVVLVSTCLQTEREPLASDYLFWRAFSDFGVGIRMALSTVLDKQFFGAENPLVGQSSKQCAFASAFLELFLISAQLWVFVLAADLIRSLKYPFSSSLGWAQVAQACLWTTSLCFALVTGLDQHVYGFFSVDPQVDSTGICFIKQQKKSNVPFVYIMFYIPLIISFIVGCVGIGYTYARLKHGIPSTVIPRINAVSGNIINILIYVLFSAIWLCPICLSFLLVNRSSSKVFWDLTVYLIGAEGISALIVMIMARNRVNLSASLRQDILTYATSGIRSCADAAVTSEGNFVVDIEANVEPDLGQLDIGMLLQFIFGDEEKLLHVVDMQLSYRSSRATLLQPTSMSSAGGVSNGTEESEVRDENRLSNLLVQRSNRRDGRHDANICTFTEFEPSHFRRIRSAASVSVSDYISQFRKSATEKVTKGGASGAFFFFSNDDKFIAKSCSKSEFNLLVTFAPHFAEYFESSEGKYSFIGRILGAYSLTLYGIEVYFFVMSNLLGAKDEEGNALIFEERYDLKGSTVGRGVVFPDDGDRCTCAGCKMKFTYISKSRPLKKGFGTVDRTGAYLINCRCTVSGKHEPSLLMKDNDLKYKLRLLPEEASAITTQLEHDAAFLCRLGVMDYSLLLGVHHMTYRRATVEPGSPQSNRAANLTDQGTQNVLEQRRFDATGAIGPAFYQFGIIDFLQTWNFSKMIERFCKVRILGKSAYGLSAIEPGIYKDRFVRHVKTVFGAEDDPEDPEIQRLNSEF
jgi:predicted lipoprotein with Yx(FWY)xxD motif